MRNFHYSLAFAIQAVLLLIGCSSGHKAPEYSLPEYKEETTAKFELMTGELYGLNNIRDICVYKSYIMVVSRNLKDGTLVHVYDRDTGTCLLNTLGPGRGPKEYLYDRICSFDETDGVFRLYDDAKQNILRFQLDSLVAYNLSAVSSSPYVAPSYSVEGIVESEAGRIVVSNILDSTRIALYGYDGTLVSSVGDYPYIEEDEEKKKFIFSELRIASDPSMDKLAIGTSWGGILETYSIDGQIRQEAVGYYARPSIELNKEGAISPNPDDRTVLGFNDIYATDDRIYASFDGEVNIRENSAKPLKDRELLWSGISVFDWDCRGLKRIRTDYRIERLCVDEADGIIYAVLNDIYGRAYIGRIKL